MSARVITHGYTAPSNLVLNSTYPVPQGSPLDVSTSDADQVNAVATDFGHGGGTTQFILSLLLVGRPFSSGLPLLVPLCLRDTHF